MLMFLEGTSAWEMRRGTQDKWNTVMVSSREDSDQVFKRKTVMVSSREDSRRRGDVIVGEGVRGV
jgi:hypothetical protein